MTRNSKKTTKPQNGSDDGPSRETPGPAVFIGVVLLAAALFNIPSILKAPETTADKMMLVTVIAMAAGGLILLIFGRKKE